MKIQKRFETLNFFPTKYSPNLPVIPLEVWCSRHVRGVQIPTHTVFGSVNIHHPKKSFQGLPAWLYTIRR